MTTIDPSLLKIWYAWVKWWNHVPYWDPYGAAFTLVAAGFVSGYLVYRLIHERYRT